MTNMHKNDFNWRRFVQNVFKFLRTRLLDKNSTAGNSTYPKGGGSCSKESFAVTQTVVFQIKFCGKSPAHRVAANRQTV